MAWFVKMLKGSSAHYVNQTLALPEYHFAWQRGYGSLTLGERQLARAVAYVLGQKQHHDMGTTIRRLEYVAEFEEGPGYFEAGSGDGGNGAE